MPDSCVADAPCAVALTELPLALVRRIVEARSTSPPRASQHAHACCVRVAAVLRRQIGVRAHEHLRRTARASSRQPVRARKRGRRRRERASSSAVAAQPLTRRFDARSVWVQVATRQYGAAFWAAAAQRPRASARSLGSRRWELLRMARWERRYARRYGREWDSRDYAALWRWRDGREELRAVLPHMLTAQPPGR